MIRVSCAQCAKTYQVDQKFAGRRAKCLGCAGVLAIPAIGEAAAPATSPPAASEGEGEGYELAAPPPAAAGGASDEGAAQPEPQPHALSTSFHQADAAEASAWAPQPVRTSSMAVAALVLGLLGCIPPLGLGALVLGILALRKTGNPDNRLTGHGMAVTGVALGSLTILLYVVGGLLVIPLMSLGKAGMAMAQLQRTMNLQMMHGAMEQHAAGNNGRLPGVSPQGAVTDGSVPGRLQPLVDGNLIPAAFLLHPQDSGKRAWTAGKVTLANVSYAMLEIEGGGGRLAEWRGGASAKAALLSDRDTATSGLSVPDGAPAHRSLWSAAGWEGAVAWGDGHVTFEKSDTGLATQYGTTSNASDALFEATGTDDALMVYR